MILVFLTLDRIKSIISRKLDMQQVLLTFSDEKIV